MNIKQKLTSAVVLGSMVAAVVAPASFAATNTVTVTGNGAFSITKAKVVNMKMSSVTQSNTTFVSTDVKTSANTGGNSSSFNTGGTNTVTSGDAGNTVTTTVTGGSNTNSNPCGCADTNTNSLTVSGNGAFSYTSGKIVNVSSNSVSQTNTTIVTTNVDASSSTGGNSSSFNTGGSSSVTSGNAGNMVNTTVTAGGNSN